MFIRISRSSGAWSRAWSSSFNACAASRRCKAAIAWGAGQELSYEDVEVLPPRAHEVRIQIYYTGVCHTGNVSPAP